MLKSILIWLSFGTGSSLVILLLLMLAFIFADNIRQRAEMPYKTPLSWLFRLPDFIGNGGFLTDSRAWLCGMLGLALILFALGFHLRHR